MKKFLIIVWAIILLLAIGFVVKKVKSAWNEKKWALVNITFWTDNLLEKLWRTKVSYPLIWFWWNYVEPTFVESLEEYKKDYLYWSSVLFSPDTGVWVEYFIDNEWRTFNTSPKTLRTLGSTDERIADMTFESISLDTKTMKFEDLKEKIISGILATEDSVYKEQVDEFKSATNNFDLVISMKKGNY